MSKPRITNSTELRTHYSAKPISFTHEEIARAAYDIHLKRERPGGSDLEDWLEAEQCLIFEHTEHSKQLCGCGYDNDATFEREPRRLVV